jgi:hypothetical protein
VRLLLSQELNILYKFEYWAQELGLQEFPIRSTHTHTTQYTENKKEEEIEDIFK